jgi:hypothetical protein
MNPLAYIAIAIAAAAAYLYAQKDEKDETTAALPPAGVLPGITATTATVVPITPSTGGSQYGGFSPTTGGGGGGGGGGSTPTWHQWGYTGIPNVSDDDAGYNTELYPTAKEVREAMIFLGYAVGGGSQGLSGNPLVKKFQQDWNEAADVGFQQATGEFLPDTSPGTGFLRALEIAAIGTDGAQMTDLVRGWKWSDRFN